MDGYCDKYLGYAKLNHQTSSIFLGSANVLAGRKRQPLQYANKLNHVQKRVAFALQAGLQLTPA